MALRRAALPLRLLVPRRRVAAGGARRARRRARLRGARAHRPRRRLRLARVRPRGEGARRAADHRRRGDARRRRARDAARRDGRGYANLCRILTAAHAGTRRPGREDREPLPPEVALERRRGAATTGSSASPAARATGSACATRTAPPGWRRRSAATASSSSCSGRSSAATPAARRCSATSRSTSACATVATGNVHAHDAQRARCCRTCSSRSAAAPRSTAASASGAATARRAAPARGDGRALRRRSTAPPPSAPSRSPSGSQFDLTEELGYRYPDFSDGPEPAIRQLARDLRGARSTSATRLSDTVLQGATRARARLDDELALIDELGLAGFFLLHWEVLELARECRARGARPRLAAPLPAAGARARQLGRLDRLLPDRPLARRPGRERPLARPLPEPRARVRAGHRPRLPARHPREADRRASPSATGASTPRSSRASPPTARAARSATSARRSGCRTAELERLARVTDGWNAQRVAEEVAALPDAERKLDLPRWRAFQYLTARDRRPAAPRLPAPGRHGHLDAAARRARPRAAGRDGRAPALPVGQGLVRRRRLPQDRPARARDAVRRRGLRRADRRACTASRSTSRGSRSTTRRCSRRSSDADTVGDLPDREPRADAEPAAHAAGDARRPHRPGRARAARPDPGQGGAPVHRAPPAAARGPGVRLAGRPRVAARAARAPRSASSSSRTRCSTWRSRSPASRSARRRGCAGR